MSVKQSLLKSAACVMLAATMTLTGCGATSKRSGAYGTIYQPNYLYLEAGKTIQTKHGEYTPQTNEKWVHPRVLEKLDREAVNGQKEVTP